MGRRLALIGLALLVAPTEASAICITETSPHLGRTALNAEPGRIVVYDGAHTITVFDSTDGTVLWHRNVAPGHDEPDEKAPTPPRAELGAWVVSGERLVVYARGVLEALDLHDGKAAWSIQLGDVSRERLALAAPGSGVLTVSWFDGLHDVTLAFDTNDAHRLRPRDGVRRAPIDSKTGVATSTRTAVVLDTTEAYAHRGRHHDFFAPAEDIASSCCGAAFRRLEVRPRGSSAPGFEIRPREKGDFLGAWSEHGPIVTVEDGALVRAFDPKARRELWSRAAHPNLALAAGLVFVEPNTVDLVDLTTGRLVWSVPLAAWPVGATSLDLDRRGYVRAQPWQGEVTVDPALDCLGIDRPVLRWRAGPSPLRVHRDIRTDQARVEVYDERLEARSDVAALEVDCTERLHRARIRLRSTGGWIHHTVAERFEPEALAKLLADLEDRPETPAARSAAPFPRARRAGFASRRLRTPGTRPPHATITRKAPSPIARRVFPAGLLGAQP